MAALFLVSSAHAARLEVSTGDPVEVRIAVGTPTVVTFPEGIQAIPTSADPAALSLEIEGERLFIQSLREGFGTVLFVVGKSGRLHLLKLVEHEPPDTEVQLILPQVPSRFGETPPVTGRPRRPPDNPLRRLMVAMLKGDTLPGVEVLAHDQPLASSAGGRDSHHAPVRRRALSGLPRHGTQPDGRAVRAAPAGVPGARTQGDCR